MPELSPEMQATVLGWAVNVAKAVGLLIVVWIAGGWARRATINGLKRAHFDATLSKFFSGMARWVVLAAGLLAALSIFGISTTSFAALLGGAGLAVGLAFSGTLGSFAAGVLLLTFRPFKVGDFVSVSGETGTVDEVGVFTTTLDTPDNRRVILPNSGVFGSTIENVSHHPIRRADVAVGADYSADIDRTREVLEAAARDVPGRLADRDPQVVLVGLGGSSVDWQVRVWAAKADYLAVKQATTRAVKLALDQAGIGIPFPQMDVHLDRPAQTQP